MLSSETVQHEHRDAILPRSSSRGSKRCSSWSGEITRAGYEGMLGAGVVVTGGTSLLEGMPDAAEHVLNLPARRGVPTGIGGLRDIVSNPMHATGVGLLLHARRHTEETATVGLRSGRPIGKMLDRMKSWMFEFF